MKTWNEDMDLPSGDALPAGEREGEWALLMRREDGAQMMLYNLTEDEFQDESNFLTEDAAIAMQWDGHGWVEHR